MDAADSDMDLDKELESVLESAGIVASPKASPSAAAPVSDIGPGCGKLGHLRRTPPGGTPKKATRKCTP